MKRVLAVIPTFNEAANIGVQLERLFAACDDLDACVVDDGSPDGTASTARSTGDRIGRSVLVIERAGKNGYGSACRDGFTYALDSGYSVVLQMDADLSHKPEDVPSLLAKLDAGADIAIGSRYVPGGSIPGWSVARKLLSRTGNAYARICLGLDVFDATAGFRAYKADALRALPFSSARTDGYGFQLEMAYRIRQSGFTVVEVPIEFADRNHGHSKMSNRIVAEAIWMVTRLGAQRLLRRR
ncbi:MAG: polyprenol monophosphomannose synthase [Actinobacteria bacterium]|nr:polyprenol monophosphomannose synthase [Actinomycetota bacterium]